MGAMAEMNAKGIKPPKATVQADDADLAFVPSAVEGPRAEWAFDSDGFRQMCPRCYALLAKQRVAGKDRQTATIRFFADQGRLKVAIAERETGQTFWTTVEADGDLFVALEAALVAGRGEWRKDKPMTPRR